jgi:phage gpG-like protein
MLGAAAEADSVLDLLGGTARRVDRLRPGLLPIADEMRERNADIFSTRGRGTWQALDAATVKRKGNSRPLIDKGGLLRSLTRRRVKDAVERVTQDSVYVGTKNPIATLHKRGTGRMPARDPIPKVTDRETREWSDMLLDYLLGDD